MISMFEPEDGSAHARDGALAALNEAALQSDESEFASARSAFTPGDYEEIIALAWRYQFDDDRSKFRREFRKLGSHVSQRIVDNLRSAQ